MPQPMKVFLFLDDPAAALAENYDRIKVQRSRDRGVSWVELTTLETRLRIQTGKWNYHYLVREAEVTDLYRAVLSSTSLVSPPADITSGPQQAIDVSFEQILTIEELRTIYLFGIDLTDDTGREYPDELFAHYIMSGITQTEHDLDVNLYPKLFDHRYDYYRHDWVNHGVLQLREKPVISVVAMDLSLPPNGAKLYDVPIESIVLDKHGATIMLYPFGAGGGGIPGVSFSGTAGGFMGRDFLPGAIHVVFFAGFELGTVRALPIIKDIVGKRASYGPLNISGDLVAGAGLAAQSMSIDGLSRSVTTTNSSTNAGYGARLLTYQKEIKDAMKELKRYYGGAKMVAV
jgi:hypothetical protein